MSLSSSYSETDPQLESVTILLIDDDEHWAWATGQLLEREDAFTVETAHSLSDGRKQFTDLDPDCVVCDYDLGAGTGLELLETVRDADLDRPFVLVTGKGDEAVASKAIRQGVTDYIPKGQENEDELLVTRVYNLVRAYRTERALDRQRRTKTAVLDILRETASETELCQNFCRQLTEGEPFALTWIGTADQTALRPRASAGRDEYLDDVFDTGALPENEPARSAYETADEVISTIDSTDVSDSWEDVATAHGFESVIAVPIRYDGVTFGVLAVYLDQLLPERGTSRRLTEYAESVGYALRSLDQKRSLLSSQPVQFKLTIADSTAPLVAISQSLSATGTITSPSVVRRPDGKTVYFVYLQHNSRSTIEAAVENHLDGALLDIDEYEDGYKCSIVVSGTTPEGILVDQGARFAQTVVEDDVATISAYARADKSISQISAAVDHQFEATSVSTVWTDRPSHNASTSPYHDLTDKQRDVLRHAFHEGYFERPREATATEIAEHLGISRQTFAQHLRAAQRKVFASWHSSGGGEETVRK